MDISYLVPSDTNNSLSKDQVSHQLGPDPDTTSSTAPNQYFTSHSSELGPNSTCWEYITVRLGRFARQYMEQHNSNSISDELLQAEARDILYGDRNDMWNQTVADNPEWLDLFKKAHGIGTNVPTTGMQPLRGCISALLGCSSSLARQDNNPCTDTLKDVLLQDILEDLGVNPYSQSIMESTNNVNHFNVLTMDPADPARRLAFECTLSGTTAMSVYARQLSAARQLSNSTTVPSASTCTSPISPVDSVPTVPQPFHVAFQPSLNLGRTSSSSSNTNSTSTHELSQMDLQSLAQISSGFQSSSQPVYECLSVGLRSFSPSTGQECTFTSNQSSSSTHQGSFHGALSAELSNFPYSPWNEIPDNTSNIMTSSGFQSNIPASVANATMSGMDSTVQSNAMNWDDNELNFVMDMDMDMEIDLDALSKL